MRAEARFARPPASSRCAPLQLNTTPLLISTGDLKKTLVAHPKPMAAHRKPITAVAFSPDNSKFASASFDVAIQIWDAATHELEATLTKSSVTDKKDLPSGWEKRITSEGHEYFANHDDKTTPWTPLIGSRNRMKSLAFLRGEKVLVSVFDNGAMRLWDSSTGDLLNTLASRAPTNVMVLSADSR